MQHLDADRLSYTIRLDQSAELNRLKNFFSFIFTCCLINIILKIISHRKSIFCHKLHNANFYLSSVKFLRVTICGNFLISPKFEISRWIQFPCNLVNTDFFPFLKTIIDLFEKPIELTSIS